MANITEGMVNTADINDAVEVVTSSIIQAAEKIMGKTSTRYPKHPKPWLNQNCKAAFKAQKKAWVIFRRYPTARNLIAFQKAKANARRIRRQSQRDSWRKYVSSITSFTSSKAVWDKINKKYASQSLSMLENNGTIISNIQGIADILGERFSSSSSNIMYSRNFQAYKAQSEKQYLNFHSSSNEEYNVLFTSIELHTAISRSGNTAVHPDKIHYSMIKNLSNNSLINLLNLFNRMWTEYTLPDSWRLSIIIFLPTR
ncbi:uncharacterized protein LOC111613871 [Centruroides sculpturatus]|uniref:uncharacterized protein LOC111613871 n=1 Tax=Centruroides sculpturatus TaxID=218467 RepID=UPI000C6D3FC9|nr:uncharacterized protein LOC111613871 [Centruroides sculpturatus]